jgi:hypothetical protein
MEKELTVRDVYLTFNKKEKEALLIFINYMYGKYEPGYKLRDACKTIINLKEPKRIVLDYIIDKLEQSINKGD